MCFLVGETILPPPTDTVIEGDRGLTPELLCTECLAELNGHMKTWVDDTLQAEQEQHPISEEEAGEFLDLIESHQWLTLTIRSGFRVIYWEDGFLVWETRLPAGHRVETAGRSELIGEITNQVDVEVSRADRQNWSSLKERFDSAE